MFLAISHLSSFLVPKTKAPSYKHSTFLASLLKSLLRLDTSKLIIARDVDTYDLDDVLYIDRKPSKHVDYYDEQELMHMTRFVADNPEEVADMLQDFGVTIDEMYDLLNRRKFDDNPY